MKNNNNAQLPINIQLFAEGAEGAESSEATAESTDAQVGENTEEAQEDNEVVSPETRRAEFEKLIKGDFKEQFTERTQQIIDRRFRETKIMEESQKKIQPILQKLTAKYGVAENDIEALSNAIANDDSIYEEFAIENGLTLEQARAMKELEDENKMFKQVQEERQRQEKANEIYANWIEQSEQTKQLYPDFDLGDEMQENEAFVQLMQAGIDIKTAYEVAHKDEILTRIATVSVKNTEKKIVDNIKAKGIRPAENGMSSQGAISTSKDISKLSNEEIDEYIQRARKGEIINFTS